MRPDLAIMYFEYCLEELPLDEDERACYELAIEVLKRQESVVRELEEEITRTKEKERQCFMDGNTQLGFTLNGRASAMRTAIEIVRGGRNEI